MDGKISDESPFGKAMLGKKVGDVVEVEAPICLLYTSVFGFFGMNIGEGQIPGDWVWWMPLAITVVGCFFAWWMLKKKNLD